MDITVVRQPCPGISYGLAIIESLPTRRNIFYSQGAKCSGAVRKNYFLSFPKIMYFIQYSKHTPENKSEVYGFYNLHICFVANGKKFIPSLPNIDPYHLKVCTGAFNTKASSLEALVEQVIQSFWNAEFNIDMPTDCCAHYNNKKSPLSHFDQWQQKTKSDPNWVPTENELVSVVALDGRTSWMDGYDLQI